MRADIAEQEDIFDTAQVNTLHGAGVFAGKPMLL
jgi:hypothetical protein